MSAITNNNINSSTQTQGVAPLPVVNPTTQATQTVFRDTVAALAQMPDNQAQYQIIQAQIAAIVENEPQAQPRCCIIS